MATNTQPTGGTRGRIDLDSPRLNSGLVAFFRVGIALMWIQNVAWKPPPDFGEGDQPRLLYRWTLNAVDHEVAAPFAWIVENIVLPNFRAFGWGVLILEASLGAFLLVGLLTRFWALVGIAQTAAITLSALNAPHEWHWAYVLMGLAHVALFATAAGRHYGLDGVLRGRYDRDRAVIVFGAASLLSLIFIARLGDFRFVVITDGAIVVAALLGLLAVVAGALRNRLLAALAGLAFVAAAVLQVVLVATDTEWLGGNLTTTALWLGLGVGLLTAALVHPDETAAQRSNRLARLVPYGVRFEPAPGSL